MARVAGRARQVVVIVDVTIRARAWRNNMRPGQRKAGLRVIELPVRPLNRVMTLRARRREARVRYWSLRVVEVVLVTRDATRVRNVVVVVDVAVYALSWRHHVRAIQREGSLRMVKRRGLPCGRCMALLAGRRKPAQHVTRIRRSLEVLLVARNASRARQVVIIIDVAIGANSRRNGVASGKRKAHRTVIELCVQPVIRGVTGFACRRKAHRRVVWRICSLEVRLVARIACRRHRLKFAVRRVLVAGIAIDRSMRSC